MGLPMTCRVLRMGTVSSDPQSIDRRFTREFAPHGFGPSRFANRIVANNIVGVGLMN